MYRTCKCLSRRSSVSLAKCPTRPGALSSPAVPSGWSRGLNKPRPRYCNPTRQFSKSSRGLSAGQGGASTQVPGGSEEKTYRRTAGGWRGGKPECIATLRRNGRDTNCARQKEGAPISAYSVSNKRRQDIFQRPATVQPSPGLDETLHC